MKRTMTSLPAAALLVLACLTPPAGGLAESPVAWWSFDANEGRQDAILGHHEIVAGIRGTALRSDEFETAIECEAASLPPLTNGSFTLEAWIAPRAFPWNYCPIAGQRDGTNGFLFRDQSRICHQELRGKEVVINLDGNPAAIGDACRVGFPETPAGQDLILWLRFAAESPTRLAFRTVPSNQN